MLDSDTELSSRELEILRLVATGASNKEIAQRLTISANTVKVHLRNIFTKINVASRTEAAMYAVNSGLVERGMHAGEIVEEMPLLEAANAEASAASPATVLPAARMRLRRGGRVILAVIGFVALAIAGYLVWRSTRPAPASLPLVASSTWKTRAPMPTARSGLAVAVYGNKIYALAGETQTGVSGAVEAYDPTRDAWVQGEAKPLPVAEVSAAVIGGKIYVPGGRLDSGESTDVLEYYDPEKDQWKQGANLPVKTSAYALTTFEGKLYMFGGLNGEDTLDTVLEYDPDQDTWEFRTPLPSPRAFAGAVTVGEKIYLMGGMDGQKALDTNETYAPNLEGGAENPWSTNPSLPQGRYGMGISSVMDVICLVGGVGDNGAVLPDLGYLTRTGEWQPLAQSVSGAWSGLGLISLEGEIFALGGEIDQTPTAESLSYQVIYITVLPFVR